MFREIEMPEAPTNLICGWGQNVVQKNHLSITIESFRHYCKKGKALKEDKVEMPAVH